MIETVNRFLQLVQECKDRLPKLAAELQAKNYTVSWSAEQEDHYTDIEFSCRISCSFGKWSNYNCSSYVSLTHDFDTAAASIRDMHAKWLKEESEREIKRSEEEIKQRLYEDYLKQSK